MKCLLTCQAMQGGPRKKRVVILLSANRSQTIGVLLSHLKMPHEDFRRAIKSLDTRTLQPRFLVQLMKLLPTDQEVAALQSYTGPKEEEEEEEEEEEGLFKADAVNEEDPGGGGGGGGVGGGPGHRARA